MFRSIALFNKGKVSKWFHQKRYGFIVEEGTNKSYFVHRQGLNVPEGAVRALSIGQEVEFEIAKDDDDREKAVGVTAVGGGPPQAPRPPQRQFDDRRPRQQGDRGGYDRGGRSSDNNGQRHDKQSIKHNDPYTWPKDLEVEDTRAILRGKVSENTPVNYYVLTALRRTNMFDQLLEELQKIIKQPPSGRVNAEEYLSEHLNNKAHKCSMALQERAEASDELTFFLAKPYWGSNKRCRISCFSPRGSGKTQFLKHYFFKFHEEAIKHGRVIVRCCDKAESGGERWIKLVMEGKDKRTPLDHARAGLCELIQSHVESVTGRDQQKSDYDSSNKAYASWIRVTKSHFNIPDGVAMDPLIVLDTCEVLGETDCKHEVHTRVRPDTPDTPFTLLEGGVHVALTELLYSNAVPNALTYFGSSAHHDAYIYCRKVEDGGRVVWKGAVPLQLRNGRPKSYGDLKPQLMTIREPEPDKENQSDEKKKKRSRKGPTALPTAPPAPQHHLPLLLSVNQNECKPMKEDNRCKPMKEEKRIVMIEADKMSTTGWLWLLAPGEQE
ncbi:Bodo-specific multi-copy gene family, putative [Bodo saltans]|uniref:Bodo-specific multi-copy gene family, putative n=1 Tax=Bodo saltans TaxID=75058 RepID=A0A0S4IPN3_BODSA|nr:Bodo-specific multi-copy gene family, putative [Bodo saltans]|eukprot:CUF87398.1 Bodo-specific multi-copy gene family, putative [Bodo saltans]